MQHASKYKPSKIPKQLAWCVVKEDPAALFNTLKECSKLLFEKFEDDEPIIDLYSTVMQGINPFEGLAEHKVKILEEVTPETMQTDFYKNFQEGYGIKVELIAFVIIPNKIVLGICFPNQNNIKIKDEYPYMLLFKGGIGENAEKEILKELFNQNGDFQYHYLLKFKEFNYGSVMKCEIKLGKDTTSVYVANPWENHFACVSKAVY